MTRQAPPGRPASMPAKPETRQDSTGARALAAQEEYLSVRQLCERIPYKEQTVRNLMTQGVLRRGEHYIKPRGRVIFRWSAVQAWLEGQR